MIGNPDRWQEDLFVAGTLKDLIPDDHILKRVDAVLDLTWLRDAVRETYCEDNGRPSIAPETALRLMLAGYFQGIVHDRKLIREAQVNLAIRWFAGYRLHERLPSHSSLTHVRQRWGAERFRRIFQETVELCMAHGLVSCETVHFDATLVRANASIGSMTEEHARRVWEENAGEAREEPPQALSGSPKKMSKTDPEATLATSQKSVPAVPSYKQHTAVDSLAGVVVDVSVTTGERGEGGELLAQVSRVEETTGKKVGTVTADKGYSSAENYRGLEERGTGAVIPTQRRSRGKGMALERFKYDAKRQRVKCRCGQVFRRHSHYHDVTPYRSRAAVCSQCALKGSCLPAGKRARLVHIVDGYDALLRARRRRLRDSPDDRVRYRRHRFLVEGAHGEAKTVHGLSRAVRRGRWNVEIQSYLTAAVMNLKRVAFFLVLKIGPFLRFSWSHGLRMAFGSIRKLFRAESRSTPLPGIPPSTRS